MKHVFGVVVFGLLVAAFGCANRPELKDKIVLCVDRVKTASWQAYPLRETKAELARLHPAALSTVWGRQTFLVKDKLMGAIDIADQKSVVFMDCELRNSSDQDRFAKNAKKAGARAVGFVSLTVDAPVIERGSVLSVTQQIWYKVFGSDGRVWTANNARRKVSSANKKEEVVVCEAMDATIEALSRQILRDLIP